jgi:hypothetical protein
VVAGFAEIAVISHARKIESALARFAEPSPFSDNLKKKSAE